MVAWSPGRVNLIGDHTDTTGGLALPMAIDLGTTVTARRGGDRIVLRSDVEAAPATVALVGPGPGATGPGWERVVAAVAQEIGATVGLVGVVQTTLPVGAGLSSSAALELAVALALGAGGSPLELARACQRAEQRATGVPTGILDQLTCAAGVAGAALLLDARAGTVRPVGLPDGLDIVVVHSGQSRTLVGSGYAERQAELARAELDVGPLRDAVVADLASIGDDVARRRARHVLSENARVEAAVDALASGDRRTFGALLGASHASLRDDFEVSTPALDDTVERLLATPGVLGARLTGAGFGGCVVAAVEAGAPLDGWRVRPSAGARLL